MKVQMKQLGNREYIEGVRLVILYWMYVRANRALSFVLIDKNDPQENMEKRDYPDDQNNSLFINLWRKH